MKQGLLFKMLTILLISCDSQNLEPENIAVKTCSCFEQQTSGNIDDRLKVCMINELNQKTEEIHNQYYSAKPFEKAIETYMMDCSVSLIKLCDTFYQEMNSKYLDFFPELTAKQAQQKLDSLESLNIESIEILNEKLNIRIREKRYVIAQQLVKKIRQIDQNEHKTEFALAYIYNNINEFDKALIEIDNAIEKGKSDYRIIKAIIEQNKKKS